MPLYEYQCTKCGVRFEKIQKFSDPLVDTCPTCGGRVEKLLSAPAFTFKGTGFYITDYSRKGEAAAGEKAERAGKSSQSDKGDTSDTSSKASSSSEKSTSAGSDKSKDTSPAPAAKPAKSD